MTPKLIGETWRKYPTETSKQKVTYGLFECQYCKKEFEAQVSSIKNGHTKSCGCLSGEKHGLTSHKFYRTWNGMLQRCYDPKLKQRRKTYEGCFVDTVFLDYEYFKEWCHNQKGFGNKGWNLDKDILSNEVKVYSPDTCCFIPPEINSMFAGFSSERKKHIGVFENSSGNFYVRTLINGVKKSLGTFPTKDEAEEVYKAEKRRKILLVLGEWEDELDVRVVERLSSLMEVKSE